MMKAQEWLEKNYPDKKTYKIYLNQQLEGILDCSEYKDLWKIFISSSVDSSKLEIKKGSCGKMKKGSCGKLSDVGVKIEETEIIPCLPAQAWLDQQYPTQKEREEVEKLNIWEKALEGTLDLTDFKNLEELRCSNNCLTNLNLNNCWKLKRIWCSDNYLTQIIYPTNPEKITWLVINNNNLATADLTVFRQWRNLEGLYIDNEDKNKINQNIYNHFVGSCEPLKELNKLKRLNISNTDLNSGWEYLPDSLEYFKYNTELRPTCKLAQANKAELEKELWKDIHEDFISKHGEILKKDWLDAGFSKEQTKKILEEWNPVGVRPKDGAFINWFLNFKKLDLTWACENEEEFKDLRDKHSSFGTCEECKQPNTGRDWCQSCNAQHFEEEFNTWTSGNSKIDKFIQKCQLEATSNWNLLEWIPYENFTEIEHIAKGGFGKVEKAGWEVGSIGRWDKKKKEWERDGDNYDIIIQPREKLINYLQENPAIYQSITNWTHWTPWPSKNHKTVALKTLFNSQSLNQNFLAELTLYKMFRSEVSQMVPCYGISKDREGNYIMVMKYMPEGNLREYLRNNYRELKFYDNEKPWKSSKINFLKQIIQGLKDIHRKKLMHRDFHSGNIIVGKDKYDKDNCHITDLGLAQPVNEVKQEGKIYGLMPYMAPEVLKGERYTPVADIYSLGMIMYETLTCLPPYAEQAHDTNLALKILQGIRPQFPDQVKYPQLLVDLIVRCWNIEPNNRPTAREINGIIREWFLGDGLNNLVLKKDTKFYHQFQEAEAFNKTLPEEIKYPTHHSAEVWHSKPINTQQITHLLESHNLTLPISLPTTSNNSSLSTRQFKRQLSLSAESSASKTVRYQETTESMETDENEQSQTKVEMPPKH